MKSITKLSLIAAILAVIPSTAALADNQQQQNILTLQRAQNAQGGRTTTVAAYADDRGVGRHEARVERREARVELRSSAHGEKLGVYAPGKK